MSDVIKLSRPARNARVHFSPMVPRVIIPVAADDGSSSKAVFPILHGSNTESSTITTVVPDERLLRREYERGVADGAREREESLRESLETQLESRQKHIDQLLQSLAEQFTSMQQNVEYRVLQFAIAIAERIVKRELALQPDLVINQVKDAIRRLVGVERIKVRIHPSDEQIIRGSKSALLSASDSLREITIDADDNVEVGGCIIESDTGNVDAQLSTQLEKIEAALIESKQ